MVQDSSKRFSLGKKTAQGAQPAPDAKPGHDPKREAKPGPQPERPERQGLVNHGGFMG